ncbi:MAG: YmfQ family protein [Myxococcota bacterium]|nr:YmfQ family protein [Myxococcota bacterium]
MSSILLLHFDEPAGLMPSDAAGNLDDLGVEAGIIAPTSVEAWTGAGRRFVHATGHAMIAADLAGQDTLLQRDLTIRALLSVTLAGAADPQTIIARGNGDGSASEHYAFGLELEQSAVDAANLEVRLFHADSTGVVRTMPPGVFQHAGDGKEILLTATRRWESSSKVVVRYYVNEHLIAELVSANGDISGGTTGRTTIGARKAAGVWGRFFSGTLDELEVLDREVSPEDVRELWRRLTVHQPAGVETFTGLIPPGLRWAKDPGNASGRRVKVAGQALGLGIAAIEELRALFLPDAAPLDLITRWEKLAGVSPKPRDSLDVRRSRVNALLAREESLSIPAVKTTIEGPLDALASQIEILEFTNTVADSFATIAAERWLAEPAAAWTIVTNQLHVAVAGGIDVRWETQRLGHHIRTPLCVNGINDPEGRLFVSVKLSAWALQVGAGVGMLLHNGRTGNTLWFGIFNNAGTIQLGYRTVTNNVAGAWTPIVTPWVTAPVWLRLYTLQGTGFAGGTGTYTFGYSTTGPTTGFTDASIVTGVVDIEWAGFGVFGTSAALAGALSADFDDFLAFCPDGLRPFNWYAYRDPTLGGEPDLVGARLLIQKIKPAHTYASAIESKSVLCDNVRYGGCDRGPMGGL